MPRNHAQIDKGTRRGLLTPQDFGAVADAPYCQQEAIDAWLAAGGELCAPPGTYLVRTFRPVSFTHVKCASGQTVFKAAETVPRFVPFASDLEEVTLEGMTFDCDMKANIGVELAGTNVKLIDFCVRNVRQPEAGTTTAVGVQLKSGLKDFEIAGFRIENVQGAADRKDGNATGAARGIASFVASDTHPRNGRIFSGRIVNIGPREDGDGLALQGGSTPCNIRIWDVAFERCAKRAVKIVTPGVTLSDFTVSNPFGYRPDTASPSRGGANMFAGISIYASDTVVRGGRFRGGRYLSYIDVAATVGALFRVKVTENTSEPYDGPGTWNGHMHIYAGEHGIYDSYFDGNLFDNAERFGAWVRGRVVNSSVSGNTLTGCKQQAILVERIAEHPGDVAEGLYIDNNEVETVNTLFASAADGIRISHGSYIRVTNNRPVRTGITGRIVSIDRSATRVSRSNNAGERLAPR